MKNYYKEFIFYSSGKVLEDDMEDRLLMYFGLENLQTHEYCITLAHYFDPNDSDAEENLAESLNSMRVDYYYQVLLDRINGELPAKDWCSTIEEAVEAFEYVDESEDDDWEALLDEAAMEHGQKRNLDH